MNGYGLRMLDSGTKRKDFNNGEYVLFDKTVDRLLKDYARS